MNHHNSPRPPDPQRVQNIQNLASGIMMMMLYFTFELPQDKRTAYFHAQRRVLLHDIYRADAQEQQHA